LDIAKQDIKPFEIFKKFKDFNNLQICGNAAMSFAPCSLLMFRA